MNRKNSIFSIFLLQFYRFFYNSEILHKSSPRKQLVILLTLKTYNRDFSVLKIYAKFQGRFFCISGRARKFWTALIGRARQKPNKKDKSGRATHISGPSLYAPLYIKHRYREHMFTPKSWYK